MSRIRISACSANYGRAELFQVVDRLAAHGYDGIEITVMYHAEPAKTPPDQRRLIVRRVRDAGLEISALHFIFPGGLSMTAESTSERRRVVDHQLEVLRLAADLRAPVVVLGGGGVRSIPEGLPREEAARRVLGVIADTARGAEGLGVTFGLEALNRYETNFGHTLAECRSHVNGIGLPGLGVVGDTFHMNIEEASLAEAIESAGPALAHLHLPDSHRLAPGDGHIDFPPIFEALGRIGYGGWVSFEFFSISPGLWFLPTFEACDAEVVKGLRHLRAQGLI